MRNVMKAIVFVSLVLLLLGVVGKIESEYTREGIVIERESNVFTIEDTTGNLWVVEDTNLNLGDRVELKMFNNHTDNIISDDEVMKIKRL